MKYYVNTRAQDNGDHEVHNENCTRLPKEGNQKFLGEFSNCREAVREAKKQYPTANGCYYCSNSCHTS